VTTHTDSLEEARALPQASEPPPPRLWPVATVMATGVFATTFVQLQCLGNLPFYSLLISIWNIGLLVGCQTGPMLYEHVFARNMTSLLWVNAGLTMAGIVLVIFLPKRMVDQREGG